MRHAPLFSLLALVLALVSARVASAQFVEPYEADAAAQQAMERLLRELRARPALRVRSTLEIELIEGDAQAVSETVELEVLASRSDDGVRGRIRLNDFTCYFTPTPGAGGGGVDGGGTFAAVHDGNETSYFQTGYDGSPYWVLLNAFRSLPYPHLALLFGEASVEDVCMQIHPETPWIVPTAVEEIERDGARVQRITLSSPNGSLKLDVDPATRLLVDAEHEITGGNMVAPGTRKVTRYAFEHETFEGPAPESEIGFDPGDRQSVDFLASLIPARPAPEARAAAGAGLVGAEAPPWTLATLDGDAIDLAELRGKVVVLDFWATWCGPCRQALPLLHEVARWSRREQLPVEIVTINVWEARDPAQDTPDTRRASAARFWKEQGFSLPVAMDFTDETAASYGLSGIPTTVVIRADGIVHAMHAGAGPDYAEQLRAEIAAAIAALEGD